MGSSLQKKQGLISETYIYHFGRVRIYQDSHNNQYFSQSYNFIVDANTESEFIQHLRRKNQCPYLVQIRGIDVSRDKFSVTFEYLGHTLQHLIERNHQFSQQEVIRIMYNLLAAVRHLNDNESYHGDICPEFIYIDGRLYKQMGAQLGEFVFKIFDSAYFQPFLNGYYRAQKQKTYCAPEVLANLAEKRVYPLYNHHIADTFSIGLVVLYCMSGVNPLGAYSSKFDIDFYYIQSMFRLADRKGYSLPLLALIRDCLQQRNRPNATQILIKFQNLSLMRQMEQVPAKFSLKKSKATQNQQSGGSK